MTERSTKEGVTVLHMDFFGTWTHERVFDRLWGIYLREHKRHERFRLEGFDPKWFALPKPQAYAVFLEKYGHVKFGSEIVFTSPEAEA